MARARTPLSRGARARLAAWRLAWLGMDRDPRALAFVQGARGKLALHVAFFALLAIGPRVRPTIAAGAVVVLTACALWPKRRKLVIGLAGLVFLCLRPFRSHDLENVPASVVRSLGAGAALPLMAHVALGVGLLLALTFGLLWLQRRQPQGLVARRPVATLVWAVLALAGLASLELLGPLVRVFLWTFVALTVSSLWFIAYALVDQKRQDPTPDGLRLGFLRTYWGTSTTPFGKGPGYLGKFEAHDEAELAVTRLKALKLGVWGVLLALAHFGLMRLLHDTLGLATLKQSLAAHFAGRTPSIPLCWASVSAHYLLDLLDMAALGHALVSMARMAGYRIPRNSVRPLSARTLAEFWNRYFFYFKELLVDFFFFPAFMRYFKRWPRLRLAFATFAAAGFGNFLYHFLREIHVVPARGWTAALVAFESYGFYTLVLATGLTLSQLRKRRSLPADGPWRHEILPRLNVALFFCLLGLFDDTRGAGTLAERCAYALHLLGLS